MDLAVAVVLGWGWVGLAWGWVLYFNCRQMLLLRCWRARPTLLKVAFGMAAKGKKDLYCKLLN